MVGKSITDAESQIYAYWGWDFESAMSRRTPGRQILTADISMSLVSEAGVRFLRARSASLSLS